MKEYSFLTESLSFVKESTSDFQHKFGPITVEYSIKEEDLSDPFIQKLLKIDLYHIIGEKIIKYFMSIDREWKLNLTPQKIIKSIRTLQISLYKKYKYARIQVYTNLEPDIYPVFKVYYNMSVEQVS